MNRVQKIAIHHMKIDTIKTSSNGLLLKYIKMPPIIFSIFSIPAAAPIGAGKSDQRCLSSRGFISGEITTIAINSSANNKINGHKTSIATPLPIKLSALRSNPSLSIRIVAAFSRIYTFRCCLHLRTIESLEDCWGVTKHHPAIFGPRQAHEAHTLSC